ncbi:MAG TPA: glycosyl hydrolase family 28 protein [Bacteroidales bacterium]|nr:glycosyl hydrolase family 28 protein [Bacteroidales bacterium]
MLTFRRLILPLIILLHSVTAFPKDYIITDFGAHPGKLSTTAIQKAVDECFSAGGGRVVIPPGIFITGPVILKSNICIYLESGAILKGSENIDDYRINNTRRGIFFCEDACNVSITGQGTIDASGSHFYDFSQNHGSPDFERSLTRQKENYMKDGTFFTDGPVRRISMPGMTIVFFHCTKVTLSGITVKDTPIWAIRFGYCEDVLVEGITIRNNILIPNSDGIHCTASRNIRISDCDIVAGDDAIIMTGFDKNENIPAYSMAEQAEKTYGNKSVYAENMNVTNCQLRSSSAGIRIGYGQHPIRRCSFSNITIYDSNRGIGIFAHDTTDIEDLIFNNIIIETRLYNGHWWGHGEPIHLSCVSRFPGHDAGQIRNVIFSNIIATGEQGILVFGRKESRIENISFNNVNLLIRKGRETLSYGGNFDLRPAAERPMQIFEHDIPGIYAQYVTNLSINGFELEWDPLLPDFFSNAIEVTEFKDLRIDRFHGEAAFNSGDKAAIKLSEGTDFIITNSKTNGKEPAIIMKNIK